MSDIFIIGNFEKQVCIDTSLVDLLEKDLFVSKSNCFIEYSNWTYAYVTVLGFDTRPNNSLTILLTLI